MNKEFTIVIQGKVVQETVDFYSKNYLDTDVIICTWHSLDVDFSTLFSAPNIRLFQNDMPDDYGFQNINLQIYSTLAGLNNVKTKYCIKMRGDEYYSNLEYIYDEVKKEKDKIHTSPIWFRHCSYIPYHISDHLICGQTNNLKLMFNKAMIRREHYAEVTLTKAYLSCLENEEELTDDNCKLYMKKYFRVLDLKKMEPYRLTTNFFNVVFYNNFIPEGGQSISNIEMI